MRVNTMTIVALTALLGTTALEAQAVPRPDTIGANFDADKPGTATAADFDYLLGRWTYRFQARDPKSGQYGPVLTGTWTAEKTHEGMVVEDQFSTQQPDGSHGILMTYRVYNPTARNWTIQGIATKRGGPWQPGTAWRVGADRVMVQSNPATNILTRIRYYDITPSRFLWRADGSLDGGKTWMADVMLIEAVRSK